jgi:hypothetical protein
MNNLQNKRLQSGQTIINVVKRGQNKPICFGFGAVRRRRDSTVCWSKARLGDAAQTIEVRELLVMRAWKLVILFWPGWDGQKPGSAPCGFFRLWLKEPLFAVNCRRCFLTFVATRIGGDSMMKKSFGRLKKPLSFWASLLVVGCGWLPLQAADDGVAPHFFRNP